MRSILSKVISGSHRAPRPPVAVEIAPGRVLAAAIPSRGQAPQYAFQPIAAGALLPGIAESNVHSPELVTAAIRSTLKQVSPQTKAITLVLPDTSIRVFLLDFDSLPRDRAGAVSILRFRLRKVVPFDVEHTRVSFQVLSEDETGCKVLAAIIPNHILEEYEAVVRAAEYEPGVVLASGLAALAALDSPDPALTACLGDRSITTAITNRNQLLLYRTLDLAADPDLRLAEAKQAIAVAAAYFEDKLKSRPQRLYYSGIAADDEFAGAIAGPEMAVVDLAAGPEAGPAIPLGGFGFAAVAGALAGAR